MRETESALFISGVNLFHQAEENAKNASIIAALVEIDRKAALAISHENSEIAMRLSKSKALAMAESFRLNVVEAERDHMKQLLAIKEEQTIARDKFIRYVFHELRVPFHSISMSMDILQQDTASYSAEVKDCLLYTSDAADE